MYYGFFLLVAFPTSIAIVTGIAFVIRGKWEKGSRAPVQGGICLACTSIGALLSWMGLLGWLITEWYYSTESMMGSIPFALVPVLLCTRWYLTAFGLSVVPRGSTFRVGGFTFGFMDILMFVLAIVITGSAILAIT